MAKWFILAAGVLLVFNGLMARTYSYTSEPVGHCFNMDYIRVFGCFSSPVVPHLIIWGAAIIGAGLIAWSVVHGRHLKA